MVQTNERWWLSFMNIRLQLTHASLPWIIATKTSLLLRQLDKL